MKLSLEAQGPSGHLGPYRSTIPAPVGGDLHCEHAPNGEHTAVVVPGCVACLYRWAMARAGAVTVHGRSR